MNESECPSLWAVLLRSVMFAIIDGMKTKVMFALSAVAYVVIFAQRTALCGDALAECARIFEEEIRDGIVHGAAVVAGELDGRTLSGAALFHSGWSGQTVLFDLKRQRYAVVLTTRCGDYSRAKRDRFKAIAALICCTHSG